MQNAAVSFVCNKNGKLDDVLKLNWLLLRSVEIKNQIPLKNFVFMLTSFWHNIFCTFLFMLKSKDFLYERTSLTSTTLSTFLLDL